MACKWIMMIGLTVLWASVCLGMEGYSEPAPSEVGPDEAIQPVPGDGSVPDEPKPDGGYVPGDPGSDGGDQVVDSRPEDGYGVSEPGAEGGYEVINSEPVEGYVGEKPKPEDGYVPGEPGPDGEVIVTMAPDDGSEVPVSEPDGDPRVVSEGDDVTAPKYIDDVLYFAGGAEGSGSGANGEPVFVTMIPEDGSETPSNPEDGYMVITLAPEGANGAPAALVSGSVVTSLGILEWSSEWATLAVNTPQSWDNVPELAQVRSQVGLGLVVDMPGTNGPAALANFTAQFNNGTSPGPGSLSEAFGTLQTPQMPQTPSMPDFVITP